MIKFVLQTTALSVLFFSPAFCMDDKNAYLRTTKGRYYSLQEEEGSKKAFDQGMLHLKEAEAFHKTYNKYKNKEQRAKLKYLSSKFPWSTEMEQQQAKGKIIEMQRHKTGARGAHTSKLEQAIPFFEIADNSNFPKATYHLAMTYFQLIDSNPQKYKDLAFQTFEHASKKGSEEASVVLSIFR